MAYLQHSNWRERPGAVAAVIALHGLVGYALGGFTLDAVLAVLFGSLCSFLLRRPGSDHLLARGLAIVVLVGACILTVLRDNHGPALLIGAGLAVLMLNDRWR